MNPVPEFACTSEALEKLEAALAGAPKVANQQRLAALLPMAWQLRQRDTARALALTDQAQTCHDAISTAKLSDTTLPDDWQPRIQARLLLIRAEAKFLYGELEASSALADDALRDFSACNDRIGCADAYWLSAFIAGGQGDAARRDAKFAAASAAQEQDPVRRTMAQAMFAFTTALRDMAAARQFWASILASDTNLMHPAAAACVEGFFAISASFER